MGSTTTSSSTSVSTQKLPFFFALSATAAVAAVSFGYKFFKALKEKNNGKRKNRSTTIPFDKAVTDAKEDAEAIRLLQPYLEQAAELARKLPTDNNRIITLKDQMMIYGLYKQAKFGDCNIDAPSQLRIKEHAKYKAWTKFKGVAQPFAIMKYMEVIQHFSNLATQSPTRARKNLSDDDDNGRRSEFSSPLPPTTNYSPFLGEDEDDSDIIYENDNGEEDTEEEKEDDDNDDSFSTAKTKKTKNEIAAFGTRQSTLRATNHHHFDLGHNSSNQRDHNQVSDNDEECSVNEEDMTILQAATYNKPEHLKKCIQQKGSDGSSIDFVNEPDETGQTPLHMAADKGYIECVSILLEAGANVNAADDAGISVLGAAVFSENVTVVKMLLDAGADPDTEDVDGDTPRSCAEECDSDDIKELFRNL